MKLRIAAPIGVFVLLLAAVVVHGLRVVRHDDGRSETVRRGPLYVWSVYEGDLDARRVEVIMSQFNGSATIVELAPEGAPVKAGDLLVRFDNSQVQRDLLKLERDYALAKAEEASLEHAKLPLELRALEIQLLEAKATHDAEAQFRDDSLALRNDDLISDQEFEQQKLKAERARSVAENIATQLDLTRTYVHPLALERARATLSAAEQELSLARRQLASCTVTAPSAGTVVYRPLHLGTEYRTVRVGDAIYRNQPFMAIPDMREVLVACLVPEAELGRVGAGKKAFVMPLAYPELQLGGSVESVGSMAQTVPGKASWQKYFPVTIKLDQTDSRLRSGMSVRVSVLSHENLDALLVPRAAVWWENGKPLCGLRVRHRTESHPLSLGAADMTRYEVLQGLQAGDTVLVP